MSKVLRVDDESIEVALLYSTDISEAIRIMDKQIKDKMIHTTKEEIQFVVREEVSKMMSKYESGQQAINAELISRLSSLGGHSTPQEGASPDSYGFRRASVREEK